MSINPIISFKAGLCDLDTSSKPYKVKALPTKGHIYLYSEDDLIHFCWAPRDRPIDEPELDLITVPMDCRFIPYDTQTPAQPGAKTAGRIFVLKFSSSSQRHLFWLQSKPQGRAGDPAWLSPRDRKIGDIVDKLLQGEEVDVNRELRAVQNNTDDSRRGDGGDQGDATMEDVGGHADESGRGPGGGAAGGAGADATGGDVRREGESAREGGADGARAAASSAPATDAAVAVRNFLDSLKGSAGLGGRAPAQGGSYPLLNDLLETSVTIPMVDQASEEYLDKLLDHVPAVVLLLEAQPEGGALENEPTPDAALAAKASMSLTQKKTLLKKILRSPQFSQSLLSLSMALRDGGLPSVSEALGIKVENNGLVRGGNVPLGGGDAIEAFVEGVKKKVQKE